jgi:uncharacterized protein (TIGR03905 family)
MHYAYTPYGVCSRRIEFDMEEDGRVRNLVFQGGCHGNTQGIARLADGLPAGEIIEKLSGVRCGTRATSCPDQLAAALRAALKTAGAEAK